MMHDYKGLLAGWPQVLHIHSVCCSHSNKIVMLIIIFYQGAQGKRKEVDGENTATAVGVRKRGDAVSYSLLAEVAHFFHRNVEPNFNAGEHIS